MTRPSQDPESNEIPTSGWRRDVSFLPSELATVGVVLWAAQRLYCESGFSSAVWGAALAGWLLAGIISSGRGLVFEGRIGWVLRGLAWLSGVAGIVLSARALGGGVAWPQAAAMGILVGVSVAVCRWLLSIVHGRGPVGPGEGCRWALLQILVAYLLHPYVRCAFVGVGDAYHYAISLGDFIRQVRAGVFPVFIGQTEFAFNGGIHTVRTAPYFVHLGGLLDALTLGTLPFFAVGNLAIVFSAMAGALGSYCALLLYVPGRAWTACALAALYVLSPAILTPLFEGDMIATFMTVPMLPWWVLGLALAADSPTAFRPWLLQGAALAAMWWAHPPIAVWATALTLVAWAVILVGQKGRRVRVLSRAAWAALLCAVLSAYEFVSVLTLRLPPGPGTQREEAVSAVGVLAQNWKSAFLPLSSDGHSLLRDIQLGYALLLASFGVLLAVKAKRSASLLLGCMAAIWLMMIPVPWVTSALWSHVPHAVLDMTNTWPMQRFYPILAALAIFAAAGGIAQLDLRPERRAALLVLAVVSGLGWSLNEARVLFVVPEGHANSPEASRTLFRPENLTLSRVSYLFFGFFPGYFSHAPMEPLLETRLLDPKDMRIVADGSTRVSTEPNPETRAVELRVQPDGEIAPAIPIGGLQTVVLRFDFHGHEAAGRLDLKGNTLGREYFLPYSGGVKAFGSGSGAGRTLVLRNKEDRMDSVSLLYVPDNPSDMDYFNRHPFAEVTVEPFGKGGHVIELHSLLPFHATVRSTGRYLLETPRVAVPGYRARVNGVAVDVTRTPDGLVGVPVFNGTNDVVLDYPGVPALRWAFGTSACAWIAMALCAAGMPSADRSGRRGLELLSRAATACRRRSPLLVATCVAAALCLGAFWRWYAVERARSGAVRLAILLPLGSAHESEPLVTTGRTGAGDVIFVNLLGGNRISIGHDHWGHPAVTSQPLEVDLLVAHVVEVSMASLGTRWSWPWSGASGANEAVTVRWDGREILRDERGSYPSEKRDVEIGSNRIGASSAQELFKGEIFESSMIDPPTDR